MKRQSADNDALWSRHHAALREPRQIVAQWPAASDIDPATFKSRTVGPFWDIIDELELTLVVTREYEHLVQALCVENGRRRVSYLSLPHPNGLAVDRQTGRLIIASTRNPNMLFEFLPSAGAVVGRGDDLPGQWLPRRANYYPGCLYLHDIAMIGGALHGNAVGLNAIVRFDEHGSFEPVWWPRSIDSKAGPRFDKNYLQLNSIAAGPTLNRSYFGASTATPGAKRPGHRNFSVDKRGVVFSGATRDVCATGLTRPHSARLHGGDLWIDNSGYGETGRIIDGGFEPLAKLPGWTRGLFFHEKYLFVGTSRILPRFHHYAPGLDAAACIAGVHVLDRDSGHLLASYLWPNGNQIFAIEGLQRNKAIGFPFLATSRGGNSDRLRRSFGASRAA